MLYYQNIITRVVFLPSVNVTFSCHKVLYYQDKSTRVVFLPSVNITFSCHKVLYSQALGSFKKYMPPPLPYFKVNICPLPLPHFASIFFAYIVILSLTQLFRYTPEIFLFSTVTFKYKYRAPLRRIGQEY